MALGNVECALDLLVGTEHEVFRVRGSLPYDMYR